MCLLLVPFWQINTLHGTWMTGTYSMQVKDARPPQLDRSDVELYIHKRSINYGAMVSTQQQDLKNIMRELRALRTKVDKLEDIVEKRLVGEEASDKYEKKAIAEFEKRRKAGRLEFVPLSKIE